MVNHWIDTVSVVATNLGLYHMTCWFSTFVAPWLALVLCFTETLSQIIVEPIDFFHKNCSLKRLSRCKGPMWEENMSGPHVAITKVDKVRTTQKRYHFLGKQLWNGREIAPTMDTPRCYSQWLFLQVINYWLMACNMSYVLKHWDGWQIDLIFGTGWSHQSDYQYLYIEPSDICQPQSSMESTFGS